MSYDDFDRTSTIEKDKASILDLIDERLSENEELKTESTKKTDDFKLDEFNFWDNDKSTEQSFFDETPKKVENVLDNPFFGDPDAITKLRNKRAKQAEPVAVRSVEVAPKQTTVTKRIDGKVEKSGAMSSRRKKMWLGTGIVCAALMAGFVVCNFISLHNINSNISQIQSNTIVKEQQVTDLESEIANQSSVVPDGMEEVNAVTIDASELYNTKAVPSDNIFNKIARFISYLLGK